MRCLISPSGERSHGISSAGMTFGRDAYSLRNSSDLTISSARQLQVLVPERACCLSSIAAMCAAPDVLEMLVRDLWVASRARARDRDRAATPPFSAGAGA